MHDGECHAEEPDKLERHGDRHEAPPEYALAESSAGATVGSGVCGFLVQHGGLCLNFVPNPGSGSGASFGLPRPLVLARRQAAAGA